MPDGPSGLEILRGSDVLWGEELCNSILSNGLGMGVYYKDKSSKRVDATIDRKPGEEGGVYREKTTFNERLMGVILPVDVEKRELVFVSATREPGFVFQAIGQGDYERMSNLHDKLPLWPSNSFRSYTDHLVLNCGPNPRLKYILSEDIDENRYQEIVVSAVKAGQEKKRQLEEKMGATRKNLFQKLFGGD